MKTKLALLLVFAVLTAAAQTNSVHNWTLRSGAVFSGDYFTSGTEMVVIKSHGTNYLLKISELSTNDWLYFYQCRAAQRQMQLDAEAKRMIAAGWMEFTAKLIENFPEKVRDQIPGDGTIIHKYGWMDATFERFNTFKDSQDYLGFGVIDSQGNDFDYCIVAKKLYPQETFTAAEILAGALDNYTHNPLVDVAFNLKRGDRVRLIGYCDDHGGSDSHARFYIDRITVIRLKHVENQLIA